MKTESLTALCVILCVAYPQRASSEDIKLPDIEILEQLDSGSSIFDDGIVYGESDFTAPPKGKIQKADVKWLKKRHAMIGSNLTAAPNTTEGKRSPWYPALSAWHAGLGKALASELESDLFLILPGLISFVERDNTGPQTGKELEAVEAEMALCSEAFIRALAYHIQNGSGEVEAGLLRQAVRLFGNGRLVDESAWDVDDLMPVDSAGMFILNPDLAIEEVKKRSPERVRYFLTNVSEPSEFFARYAATGDGLAKLKTKYAAGKSTIDARFRTLAAWAATLPK